MQSVTFPQWFVSDQVCALSDPERHLAHIVRIGEQWFAFDATRPNREGTGFAFLGSFVRRMTAMEAAESATLQLAGPIAMTPVTPRTVRLENVAPILARRA